MVATQGGTRTLRRRASSSDPETQALENDFRRALGTKVILTRLKRGARLTIELYSDEALEELRRRLID
jgi:ParB family chromosome partitioning protein